jgi:hypothetical protein
MRRQHVINVFSWPVGTGDARGRSAVDAKGYHLVRWANRGTEYWAVSDVSTADLTRFVDLFSGHEGAESER